MNASPRRSRLVPATNLVESRWSLTVSLEQDHSWGTRRRSLRCSRRSVGREAGDVPLQLRRQKCWHWFAVGLTACTQPSRVDVHVFWRASSFDGSGCCGQRPRCRGSPGQHQVHHRRQEHGRWKLWQTPRVGSGATDDWQLYRGTGNLPGPTAAEPPTASSWLANSSRHFTSMIGRPR